MKTKTEVAMKMMVLLLLGALGCSASVETAGPEDEERVATCDVALQDTATCNAVLEEAASSVCLEARRGCEDSPDCAQFDTCYEGEQGLTGDGSVCEAQHREGAARWRELVACLCAESAASCCYFCSTPWGRLLP